MLDSPGSAGLKGQFAIVVDGLVKSYGETRVVDELSFTVARGEIFALLGPNGAGKTTTVETLEGYRRPDSGTVRVLGCDPVRDGAKLKQLVGMMPQKAGLFPTITPREALNLFINYYPRHRDPVQLLDLVGLTGAGNTRYRRLSGGEKQRLSLALALLPEPSVVFLDEPTAGLDPEARAATWEIVRTLRDDGVTVLLTTHYLEEAERLADRVAIIDHGRLLALDTPGALMTRDTTTVRIRAAGELPVHGLQGLTSVAHARDEGGGQYTANTNDPPLALIEIAELFRREGVQLTELRVGQSSLEEVFLSLTGTRT